MKTSSLLPWKSLIGKTLPKTPCRPMSTRSSWGTVACKNFS